MPKVNNGKDLVLEIQLFELKYVVLFNEFLNKSENKRPYYGLI